MLLKKQTVWLLTMLSLVVVLSVYYITSPSPQSDNVAFTDKEESKEKESAKQTDKETEQKGASTTEKNGETVVSTVENEDQFLAMRMQITDERSKEIEKLEDVVASNEASVEEKSEAKDKVEELSKLNEKEQTIETLIKEKGYDDALVRAEENGVRIVVKSKEDSKKQANEIMNIVTQEIGAKKVAVEFEPIK
ncbi:SpoIIIAH-like family protein [Priestia filamentosa]|uniref:SpoIIIAH-like family protein n=1 Tax=Priestia filamentosa TaxID=1402861 RepID=UPI0023EB2F61|nr:SpoIIIAH-like family protein [Priestia filamentosa]